MLGCVVILTCSLGELRASIVIPATNNATIQPAGPRPGVNGKQFFNMEGSANGAFASFGVVDFQSSPISIPINSISLTFNLTQANAAFTHDGSLLFYISIDTTTDIDPGVSPLVYDPSDTPTGLGNQIRPLAFLGGGRFTQAASGTVDTFSLGSTIVVAAYVAAQLSKGAPIRLVIAPGDDTVAATYAGFSNTEFAGPELVLPGTAIPEPGTLGSVAMVLGVLTVGLAKMRRYPDGRRVLPVVALLMACVAQQVRADTIQTVFVIAMENHNWAQPSSQTSPGQIFGNPAAPYINSLVTPDNPNAAQTSYASNYQNAGVGIHPSEPNYIWAEAGSNLGVLNDNDPYGTNGTNQTTTQTLSNYLQTAGKTWRSYQEDIDVDLTNNQPLPKSQYTVPLNSVSGTFTNGTNQYNGGNQYNYGAKHNPEVFFSSTNGGNNSTPSNPLAQNYAPLQQLAADLANNTVAQYNWITPDQYNDMHSTLTGGFNYHGVHYTGDQAAIAQGDNFLSILVPQIQASNAYKNNGAIIIWWDETEGGDDPSRTIGEIIISPDAKGNAYTNFLPYTHSSDLLTMQEAFGVGPCLRDACQATDLSDLFVPGSIPAAIPTPEPSTPSTLVLGALVLSLVAFASGRFIRRRAQV
jgi:hypothetical protein